MNIEEVKAKLGVSQLPMTEDTDKDGKTTDWFRNWDNDGRIAVVMHKDTVLALKSGQNPNLDIKPTVEKTGAKGAYQLKVVFSYTEADVTF